MRKQMQEVVLWWKKYGMHYIFKSSCHFPTSLTSKDGLWFVLVVFLLEFLVKKIIRDT